MFDKHSNLRTCPNPWCPLKITLTGSTERDVYTRQAHACSFQSRQKMVFVCRLFPELSKCSSEEMSKLDEALSFDLK